MTGKTLGRYQITNQLGKGGMGEVNRPACRGLALWDISPEGKRFLMLKEAKPTAIEASRKINIVVNWFKELTQRVR